MDRREAWGCLQAEDGSSRGWPLTASASSSPLTLIAGQLSCRAPLPRSCCIHHSSRILSLPIDDGLTITYHINSKRQLSAPRHRHGRPAQSHAPLVRSELCPPSSMPRAYTSPGSIGLEPRASYGCSKSWTSHMTSRSTIARRACWHPPP